MKRTLILSILAAGLLSSVIQSRACTNIIVTKGASADGSCMVSYCADSHQLYGELYYWPAADWKPGSTTDIFDWDSGRYLGRIPQVAHTWQVTGNINERQLIIGETTFGGREGLENPDGVIDYVKDYGKSSQDIYQSRSLREDGTPQGLILYRGAPVAVLDVVNPQSMKSFTSVGFISAKGLAEFKTTCPYDGNGFMDFLPPGEGAHDLVHVGLGQLVVIRDLDALVCSINEQNPAVRLTLLQHHDACRDTGSEKQISRKLDHAVYKVVIDQVFPNLFLRTAAIHVCSDVDLLSEEAITDLIAAKDLFSFQKKRPGSTGRIHQSQ